MALDVQRTYIYVGLAGEGEDIGEGGMYRRSNRDKEWKNIAHGLPQNPQVRALLVHPDNPEIIYVGTQKGPYRSDDRGEHWEALESPDEGANVWSLAFHPQNPDIMFAGYEPCAIYRSEDAGASWRKMNTDMVVFPFITTYMPPLGKRVIDITWDPSEPDGHLRSHRGGRPSGQQGRRRKLGVDYRWPICT